MNQEDFFIDSIHNAVKSQRQKEFGQSEQLSLGELMLKVEPLLANQEEIKKKYGHETEVYFDFEYAFPTGLSSWRGIYAELALEFGFIGYKFEEENVKPMSVTKFYEMLKSAIGKEYTGWKGGEFVMGKTTPIWVANDGNSGNTAVVDVLDEEYEVILITKYLKDHV